MKVAWRRGKELPKYWATSLRSAAVGCFNGSCREGATPASFMSYGFGEAPLAGRARISAAARSRAWSRRKRCHAAGTSALLPMITLGVPGSPTAAVLLGGLLIWGLQPGPLLSSRNRFVWDLIASMYRGTSPGDRRAHLRPAVAAILRIPFSIIRPGHHRDLCDRRVHRLAQLDVDVYRWSSTG